MKKYTVLSFGLLAVLAFSSCKSQESAYKKAYEKSKEIAMQEPTTGQTAVAVVPPVQTVTPQTVTPSEPTDAKVVRESVELVSGSGLKDYSVVCGSFGLKANAEGLQQTLKKKGYDAQVAFNPANKMYRVIASTFADRGEAVRSRDELRATYPDAWLLYNK